MKPSYSQSDIYLVDFEPSVGHEYRKQRPAVIIQSDHQLNLSSLITVMPLTSRTDKKHKDDILVTKDKHNRLFADSIIKVHSIVSFDPVRFLKKIGKLDEKLRDQIKDYLKIHFGL